MKRPRSRRWAWASVCAAMLTTIALVLPGSALAGVTARLYAPTHTPRVGNWSITISVTQGRRQLSGRVDYRYLFGGSVVARRSGHTFSHGVYRDRLDWPPAAVGHTITLQCVVTTRSGTAYLNWWIRVHR